VTVHAVKLLLFGTDRARPNLNRLVERVLIRDKWIQIDHMLANSQCLRLPRGIYKA
jgi:hypothetical protein